MDEAEIPRRIVQIFRDDDYNYMCALCNDGTLWYWHLMKSEWCPWMKPVPQGAIPD